MSDSHAEVKRLFGEALALATPRDRARYLERTCSDEPLRNEILSLLQAHDEASRTFLRQLSLSRGKDRSGKRPIE